MRTIEQMVQQEVMCCMSSLVATISGGRGSIENAPRARSREHHGAADLSALAEQAAELCYPIPDYEEAATLAGWTECPDGRLDRMS